jgi:hypothetical protein
MYNILYIVTGFMLGFQVVYLFAIPAYNYSS